MPVPFEFREIALPSNLPERIIGIPTLNRFGNSDSSPGFVPRAIDSYQRAANSSGITDDIVFIINDGTDPQKLSNEQRAGFLSDKMQDLDLTSPIYILTADTRNRVAEELYKRTKIDRKIIDAVTTGTEYGMNRQSLEMLVKASSLLNQTHRMLTADDDTEVPEYYLRVKGDEFSALPATETVPNSQVILSKDSGEGIFEVCKNYSLSALFDPLGKTLTELRGDYPNLGESKMLRDTMHEALTRSTQEKEAVVFEVTHTSEEGTDISDPDSALCVATTLTKFGKPDYRTTNIADDALRNEFPPQEISSESFPYGESKPFVFSESKTNVDSAVFARLIRGDTVFLPWWFVSDENISKDNPYMTVPGTYRADNEILPVLFKIVKEQLGKDYLYFSGVETQVVHERAQVGYRPDIVTNQAPASLVGNIAALESARRIRFDPSSHQPYINFDEVTDAYEAPEDHSRQVYDEFVGFAKVCNDKLLELGDRVKSESDPERQENINGKIQRYESILDSLQKQKAGWNYEQWKKALDIEIRDQIRFFGKVLGATSILVEETKKMIEEGAYPAIEIYRRTENNTEQLAN